MVGIPPDTSRGVPSTPIHWASLWSRRLQYHWDRYTPGRVPWRVNVRGVQHIST